MKIRPQILVALMLIGLIAVTVILASPDHIAEIVGPAVIGLVALGTKLLEGE